MCLCRLAVGRILHHSKSHELPVVVFVTEVMVLGGQVGDMGCGNTGEHDYACWHQSWYEDSPWWWETGTGKLHFIHSGCFVALSTRRSTLLVITEGCWCCCWWWSGPGAKAPDALQPLGLLYTLFYRSSHCHRQMSPCPTLRERSKQREVEL
jgi:hypothetical protein